MSASIAATALAQSATWVTTNASGTSFNLNTNWTGSPTYGTTGTFTFMGGTSAAMPVLTQSTTIARLVTGTTTGATASGTITLSSSSPSNVLTLSGTGTGANSAIAISGFVSLTVSANLALGGGDQTFYALANNPLTVSGTISGGSPSNTLTFNPSNWSSGRWITLSALNTFSSTPVISGGSDIRVPAMGSASGIASPLGTSGSIRFLSAGRLSITDTTAATTSKFLIINGVKAGFGDDNGPTPYYSNQTFTGTTMGSGTFIFNGSGAVSGLITDSGGTLAISAGASAAPFLTISNAANDFTGRIQVIRGTTLLTPMFGNAGFPSPLGKNATINLGSVNSDGGGTLQFSGAADASDKTFVLNFSTGGVTLSTGTGTLALTNTAAWTTSFAGSKTITLAGGGVGSLAAGLPNTTTGTGGTNALVKSGTGSWTLSGANTYTGSTAIQAGTLVFAKRTSLYSGGTASWVQANISTTANGSATLGLGVGDAEGFTNDDVTTLLTNLGTGTVATGGLRATSSWGFDTTNTGSTFTINNVIANTGALSGTNAIGVAKLGSGTLALGGANTYTLGTRIDGGVLVITNASALGSGTGFLRFGGGTLDLGGFTVDRAGGMTATAGGLTNGVISGTGGLVKTGTGTFTVSAAANTFTGQTAIQAGVIEVTALAAAGNASSLGAPTLATTITLGSGATTGTLRFIGSTSGSTNRPIQLSGSTGGGTLEAAGSVPLVLTGAVTASDGSKTLTLSGTSTQDNAVGAITKMTTGTLSIVKDGAGLWRLTGTSDFNGGLAVRNGTIVAAANDGSALGSGGVFGVDTGVTVGDSASGASGTAALLVAAGATIRREITVAGLGAGANQVVLVGGASTSGTATFSSTANLSLDRDVALVAAGGGDVNFVNNWFAGSGSGTPLANVAIGAAGYTGTVRLTRNGTLATTGAVAVRFGTAVLGQDTILDGAGTLTIDAPATLGGIGTVAAPLGGAGLVAPGNSPGILTAEALDPTGGLDLAFEFLGETPTYTVSGSSVNDILRLTGASPFLGGSLSSGNVVSLYLPASAATGGVFAGGFFTDMTSSAFATFLNTISSGSYVAYYENSGGAFSYGGRDYSLLADLGKAVQVGTTTVSGTTNFQTGGPAIDGQVTTFTVAVPEPATLLLAGIGVAAAGFAARRRRLTPSGRRAA